MIRLPAGRTWVAGLDFDSDVSNKNGCCNLNLNGPDRPRPGPGRDNPTVCQCAQADR